MKTGICFGGFCPLHQGHLDLIMRAKKENDLCFVIVGGYDNEPRGEEIGLPLRRRVSLVRKTFKDDEQIKILEINDTEFGISKVFGKKDWMIWLDRARDLIDTFLWDNHIFNEINHYCDFNWYVAEPEYKEAIDNYYLKHDLYVSYGVSVILMERENPISGTLIRENPIKYWNKIALPFRAYFSTNILITGTASEGKSTLTRDIATYFGIPYSEEYGRTYMEAMGKTDIDLTINDFQEFIMEQKRDTKSKIEGPGNNGIVISDTDNLVTLMYAKAYVDDPKIDISEEDYKALHSLAKNIQRGITWNKIFLLPPKNTFVDDGVRYMAQSSIEERTKNYNILVDLLKDFGWWDKVEILSGSYLENFLRVSNYIKERMKW